MGGRGLQQLHHLPPREQGVLLGHLGQEGMDAVQSIPTILGHKHAEGEGRGEGERIVQLMAAWTSFRVLDC